MSTKKVVLKMSKKIADETNSKASPSGRLEGLLSVKIDVSVHFYDVDSINMVWHGNYVKYLEEGREAFGRKYGIAYMDVFEKGYITPIVDMRIQYKSMARFEDTLVVETRYMPCISAKMIYDYTIYNKRDMSVVAEAQTTQLFMTREGVFEVSTPDFYREWQKQQNTQPPKSPSGGTFSECETERKVR